MTQSALPPGDPIHRFVRSDWDREFVKNPHFIPWLRTQLQIEPLNEPEPLNQYVKRRLLVVQSEQKPSSAAAPALAQPATVGTTANQNSPQLPRTYHEHPNDAKLREHQQKMASGSSAAPVQTSSAAYSNASFPTLSAPLPAVSQSNHSDQPSSNSRSLTSFSDYLNVDPTSSTESSNISDHEGIFGLDSFQANGSDYGSASMARIDSNQANSYALSAYDAFAGGSASELYTSSLGAIHDGNIGGSYYSGPAGEPQSNGFGGSDADPTIGNQDIPMSDPNDYNNIDPSLFALAVSPADTQITQQATSHWAGGIAPSQLDDSLSADSAGPSNQPPTRISSRASSATLEQSFVNGLPSKGPVAKASSLPPSEKATPPPESYDRKGWTSRASTLRNELEHLPKAPTRTANTLAKFLSTFSNSSATEKSDWSTIPIDGRIEVLRAIKTANKKLFYEAWMNAEGKKGLDLLFTWLKGAQILAERSRPKETDNVKESETYTVLLFEFIEKLPMTLQYLKAFPIGKLIRRPLVDKLASRYPPAARELAAKIEAKWAVFIPASQQAPIGSAPTSSATNAPLRQTTPSGSAPAGQLAPSSSTTGRDIKPLEQTDSKRKPVERPNESTGVKKRKVEIVKPAASTSAAANSFFSTRTVPSVLPSFSKKGKAKANPDSAAGSAAPESGKPRSPMDPFAAAMATMKGRVVSVDEGAVASPLTPTGSGLTAKGKPKKRVRWPAEEQLQIVHVVEKFYYENEDGTPWHAAGDARSLDRAEGRAFSHLAVVEEEIDWHDPSEVDAGKEVEDNLGMATLESPEMLAQIEREKTVLSVLYYSHDQIPVSPGEPANAIDRGEEPSIEQPKLIPLWSELANDIAVQGLIAEAQAQTAAQSNTSAPVASDAAVSAILAQLDGRWQGGSGYSGPPPGSATSASAPQFDTQQIGNLLSSLMPGGASTSSAVPGPSSNAWGPPAPTPWENEGNNRQRGRRNQDDIKYGYNRYGKRVPTSEIPCKNWLAGNCKFGDRCHYKHSNY